MKTVGIITMLLAFAACGGKGDELASDWQKVADEMCACKDEACAEKVTEKRSALRKKAKEMFKSKDDVPESLMKKMDKIDGQYRDCRNKLRDAAAPATP